MVKKHAKSRLKPKLFFRSSFAVSNKNLQIKTLSMVNKEKRTLDEVLGSLDEKQRQTTQNLRSLIKRVVPETVEIIRHGNITFVLDGKDFVWLTQANGHVDVEFFMGIALDSMLLKSHGIKEKTRTVRHIEVHSFKKYEPEVTRLLREAARIGLEQIPKTAAA
jgi:hypothetical protein